MRSLSIAICIGALLVQASALPAAKAQSEQYEPNNHSFKLHAYLNSGAKPADVIIGEDGAHIARRLKLSSTMAEQINQARQQTHGNITVNYIVPGHTVSAI